MDRLITKVLDIKYPIFQGAMAYISDATLAAAVSNAGGAGIIATGGRTPDWVRAEIRKAKMLTDKPFGVNLMLMAPDINEIVGVICEEQPAFVTTGAGSPTPYIDRLHAAGIKVIPVVPNTKLAKRVAAAGADALVLEGMESGGHIGVLNTMPLMTQVLPEITNIPVIAAGGFADGRGLAAALLMGAGGVQMGTVFLLAEECPCHPNMKQKLIEAQDTDTIVTGHSMNYCVRCLKNPFSLHFVELENDGKTSKEELMRLATGTNYKGAVEGDVVNGAMLAGQNLNLLTKIEPVAVIIERIMADARATLARAAEIRI